MAQQFEGFLLDLMNSPYPKTQMDVFCNGEIIIQAFNQADAKSWGFELPLSPDGGILLNLFFHKGKAEKHERFKKLPYLKEFNLVKLDKERVYSYYLVVSSKVAVATIAMKIDQIVNDMCEIEQSVNSIEVYVRAFR
jgi:hypothetical protein